jgi:hypothetical protein
MPIVATTRVRVRRLLLPITLFFALSVAVRLWRYDERLVPSNIDATYHVLLTVRAMNETPIAVHRLLPIVTLGRPLDRDVRFGDAVRAPNGIYYYTSFPPLGFVAPWAFFRVTRLSATPRNLMLFNFGLHYAATLLLALLVAEALAGLAPDLDGDTQRLVVLLGAVTYLFTFEALYSHGIVYWHHSLFQVVWLAQLVALARILRATSCAHPPRRLDVALLCLLSVIGPSVEWTGYFADAATAGVLWWRGRHDAATRKLAPAVLAGGCLAAIAFVAHFASVIGLGPLAAALRARAGARSAAHASLVALGAGYVESFGAMLPFVVAVIAVYTRWGDRRIPARVVALLAAAGLPLVENLVLAEHATTYAFDRLKVLVAIVLIIAVLSVRLTATARQRVLFAWMAVLAWNAAHLGTSRLHVVRPALSSNDALMRRLDAIARPCAIYATNAVNRGWVELTLGANAYESVPRLDSLRALVAARGACQGVYLPISLDAGESIYVWRLAAIYDPAEARVDTIPGTAHRRPPMAIETARAIGGR